MDYFGIKNRMFCFYLIIPYLKKRLDLYEIVIGLFGILIGINWAWHTGRGLYIHTKWFCFKWAWDGIADDYNESKSKFQFFKYYD